MVRPVFPIDYDKVRKEIVKLIMAKCLLDSDHVVMEEAETQNAPRPTRPYMSFKIIGPAVKKGTDSADHVSGTTWNTGGCRKMTISFHFYGNSHEEADAYMALWQSVLEEESVLTDLRSSGIAVWMIGDVADLSVLLNTGYEGRSHMDVTFGIAANVVSDFGQMDHVTVEGTLDDSIHTQNII